MRTAGKPGTPVPPCYVRYLQDLAILPPRPRASRLSEILKSHGATNPPPKWKKAPGSETSFVLVTTLDRWLWRRYAMAYAGCAVGMVALYVVVDCFPKLTDFCDAAPNALRLFRNVGVYYGTRLALIFEQIGDVLALLAAGATILWTQRQNELVPVAAAGVSTRRLLQPVFLGTIFVVVLGVANREFALPRLAARIQRRPEDPEGRRQQSAGFAIDFNQTLLTGGTVDARARSVNDFCCVIPERIARSQRHVTAQRAQYLEPGEGRLTGGWLLFGVQPVAIASENLADWREPVLEIIETDRWFLRVQHADFHRMMRSGDWFQWCTTKDLVAACHEDSTAARVAAFRLHERLLHPWLVLTAVSVEIGLLLHFGCSRLTRGVVSCMLVSTLPQGSSLLLNYFNDSATFPPMICAWLPFFLLGPAAIYGVARIET